jgi:hypothetical protein
MAVLHEHIGGHDGPTVTRRYHRAVVPWPQQNLVRLAPAAHQPVDDGEFAELLQRRGLSHRVSV